MNEEESSVKRLIDSAKDLYNSTFTSSSASKCREDIICAVAPGRVNLIGEHTDYNGGFVFPMAIGYSTVCLGTGSITAASSDSAVGMCEIISLNEANPQIIEFESSQNMQPFLSDSPKFWTNYVMGVVAQYMEDLKGVESFSLSFQLVINGNVPLGSGLSSSASLEVSIATFIEALMSKHLPKKNIVDKKTKALRCQKAENEFCNSPCGIMDQYISAVALPGSALFIDCRSLDYEVVMMGSKDNIGEEDEENPVFVICNSNVKHSIGEGEYPVRVAQCKKATEILQSMHGQRIQSLRDASLSDVELVWKRSLSTENDGPQMDELIYRRAKHVVKENERTQHAKISLLDGNWEEFGKLMNQSHSSMKMDYEVSCIEIDILVGLAQNFDGVYGSRMTGGGFGGCTVTLVKKSKAESLCKYLVEEYKTRMGRECTCFQTEPCSGAREITF